MSEIDASVTSAPWDHGGRRKVVQDSALVDAASPPRAFYGKALVAVAIVGLMARLIAIFTFVGLGTPPDASDDAYEYDQYAYNIVQGRGFRGSSPDVTDPDHLTAYRVPVPSLYYAAIYSVFGHDYAAARIANSVLGVATALLLFHIGAVAFSPQIGLIAAALWALYPNSLYYNLDLNSEVFSCFLVVAFVAASLHITGRRGLLWALAAGALFGGVLLSKPAFLFGAPLLGLWALIVSGRDRVLWLRMAMIPLMVAAAILPWMVRNARVMGEPIPFSTGGGSLLLQANNRLVISDPRYYGYAIWDTYLPEYSASLRAVDNEIRRDATARALAVQWLRDNPGRWFYLARNKFLRLWTPRYHGTHDRGLAAGVTAFYGVALLGFAIAFWPATRGLLSRRDPALVIHVLIAAIVVSAIIFHGQHRYRFPIDPFVILFAAFSVVWLARRWAERRTTSFIGSIRRGPLVATAAMVAALAVWSAADERQVDASRADICLTRVGAISRAAEEYQRATGRPPTDVRELVPQHLPNYEALHCPLHSLEYDDFAFLGTTEESPGAARVVSYRLTPSGSSYRVEHLYQVSQYHLNRTATPAAPTTADKQ